MHLFHVIARLPDRPFAAYDVDVERFRQKEPHDPDAVVAELSRLVEAGALETCVSTCSWKDGDAPGLEVRLYKLTPVGEVDVAPYRVD